MTVQISVIVPVYNAAFTMRKCLDSLLTQTLKNFEVLLIDDGSTDDSGAICDEYAQRDNRVRAFHKANGGVSSARQFGIDHAQGEYTIHADPDDWVEPETLADLYSKAKETNADMVICDFFENTYKGQKYVCQKPSSLYHEVVLKELFDKLMGSTCNKLIRRACYEKYHVKFPPELSFCEDQYVCAALVKENIKIEYVSRAYYHYFRPVNTESLSRKYNEKIFEEDMNGLLLFHNLLKDTSIVSMVDNVKRYHILAKAFYWGFKFYSSISFRKQFAGFNIAMKEISAPKVEKTLLLLSCKGFYRPLRLTLEVVLQFKHFVYKHFSYNFCL